MEVTFSNDVFVTKKRTSKNGVGYLISFTRASSRRDSKMTESTCHEMRKGEAMVVPLQSSGELLLAVRALWVQERLQFLQTSKDTNISH